MGELLLFFFLLWNTFLDWPSLRSLVVVNLGQYLGKIQVERIYCMEKNLYPHASKLKSVKAEFIVPPLGEQNLPHIVIEYKIDIDAERVSSEFYISSRERIIHFDHEEEYTSTTEEKKVEDRVRELETRLSHLETFLLSR